VFLEQICISIPSLSPLCDSSKCVLGLCSEPLITNVMWRNILAQVLHFTQATYFDFEVRLGLNG
jgi:hypothetical protein